jgi:hypothetical protein
MHRLGDIGLAAFSGNRQDGQTDTTGALRKVPKIIQAFSQETGRVLRVSAIRYSIPSIVDVVINDNMLQPSFRATAIAWRIRFADGSLFRPPGAQPFASALSAVSAR